MDDSTVTAYRICVDSILLKSWKTAIDYALSGLSVTVPDAFLESLGIIGNSILKKEEENAKLRSLDVK